MEPFSLFFLRSAVSLVLCMAYLKRAGIPLLGNNKRWLVLRGLMGMIGLSGFHTVRHIPLARPQSSSISSPVFTVLLALVFMKERVHKWQWFFLGMALVGIVMVKGGLIRGCVLGHVGTGVVVSVLRCCGVIGNHEVQGNRPSGGGGDLFHLLAVPVMGLLSWGEWVPMVDVDWGLAGAIGVLSIAAQVLMTVALHNEDAGMVMPFKYLGAVLALAIGWWGYEEGMSTLSLLGMALVVLSISANTVLKARRSSAP